MSELNELMSNCLLQVTHSVRKWSAVKVDRDASEEYTKQQHAVDGAAKVVKSLMAGADKELKAVSSAFDAVRNFVYDNTLPYVTGGNDGAKKGPRLLPSTKAMDFLSGYKARIDEANAALDEFLLVYNHQVNAAMLNQGAMADASVYPDTTALRNLFGVTMDILPLPLGTDFSRGLVPPALAEALGERMASRQESAMSVAMDHLRERMAKEVARIAQQLGKIARDEDTRLYSSLIGNIRNIADLLRHSNVTKNPDVDALLVRIDKELCGHNAEVYKGNPTLAKKTADAAVSIGKLIDDMVFL